jgi:winged helix DNA-binding protein
MSPRPVTLPDGAERTLSERELNRALLARQRLLERASSTVPKAIERFAGLQTQYARAGYIALRSRLEGFRREDLTRALERRSVVQAWMMRATIHVASKRDFWLFSAAVREQRRKGWVQAFRGSASEIAAAAQKTERFLADGPKRRAEIVKALAFDNPIWYGVNLWLDLVRIPPYGTWEQPRADLYGLASDWLGEPPAITENEGIEHLVRRYLAGFGPASRKDVASFTGLAAGALAPVLGRMPLRRFADQRGKELVDLPRAPLPDPETPAPIRFLPAWDATLLVQARRTQILPERYRPRIFNTKTPHSFHTFMIDGQVAGSWRHEKGRIVLEPFERLSKETRRSLDDEAEHMAELFA